jgi:SAM-dependent methyltransferase
LYARRRNEETPLLLGSVLDIPLTSECVEIAAALDVIEHVEDDMAGLREIWRVLRPGGAVLINVPAFESLWSEKDDANHHYRRYRRAGLRRVLENSGFRIERISYTNATLFPAIWFARQVGNVVGRPWNSRAEYHPARAVNSTLLGVLHFERALLKRTNLPLGTSITCLARRPS